MRFELHLTVATGVGQEGSLRAWVRSQRLAVTYIELSHGMSPRQWMVTDHVVGNLRTAVARATQVEDTLRLQAGFAVIRRKVETSLDGASCTPTQYLEQHVKVRVASSDLAALASLAARHGAHLSRSAAKALIQGVEERFLTQRFDAGREAEASAECMALTRTIRAGGFRIVKTERERVITDDHRALDAGWMEGST